MVPGNASKLSYSFVPRCVLPWKAYKGPRDIDMGEDAAYLGGPVRVLGNNGARSERHTAEPTAVQASAPHLRHTLDTVCMQRF